MTDPTETARRGRIRNRAFDPETQVTPDAPGGTTPATTKKVVVTKAMKDEASKAYLANKLKNANTGIEKKAKTTLEGLMRGGNVPKFEVEVNDGTNVVTVVAEITERDVASIDLGKLRKLCKDETQFMSIVSASQKAVEDALGKPGLLQCLTFDKAEGLSIGAKK